MNKVIKTYTNGNRAVEIRQVDKKFYATGMVFNGIDWQYGTRMAYKTLKAAEKSAANTVAEISRGWTKNPTWTIETEQEQDH